MDNIEMAKASAALFRGLRRVYGDLIYNVTFEHVDASGYWFSFELENDHRRQTWRVRHSEL